MVFACSSLFTRQEIARNLGGGLTAKTLKNIDSKGREPEVGQRHGKKFVYEKDSFIRWFKNYILTYGSSVYRFYLYINNNKSMVKQYF
jgi:hypothetical protein